MFSTLNHYFNISQKVFSLGEHAEKDCAPIFQQIQDIGQKNQYKILHAMQSNKLSDIILRQQAAMAIMI